MYLVTILTHASNIRLRNTAHTEVVPILLFSSIHAGYYVGGKVEIEYIVLQ